MLSMKGFARYHGITMTSEMIGERPDMPLDKLTGKEREWQRTAYHYKCILRCKRRQFTVYFSMGPAIGHEPEIKDLLDCLASDIGTFLNTRNFEEWAGEFGYDTDSRSAERTYKLIGKQKDGMQRLLGGMQILNDLCFKTERE